MGNHLACILPNPSFSTIRVFRPQDGHVYEFHQSINAAELMLQYPNYFVCHCFALQAGQRVIPLPADQELKFQQIYILLPMSKLRARFSSQDIALFHNVVSHSRTGKQSQRSQRRVTPLPLESYSLEKEDGIHEQEQVCVPYVPARPESSQQANNIAEVGGTPHLMVRSRSWMPKLETINESAVLKE